MRRPTTAPSATTTSTMSTVQVHGNVLNLPEPRLFKPPPAWFSFMRHTRPLVANISTITSTTTSDVISTITRTSTFAILYSCRVGFSDRKVLWTGAQAAWCCAEQGIGCDVLVDSPGPVADNCQKQYWNWQIMWSPEKLEWCCKHQPTLCPDGSEWLATPTRLYDRASMFHGFAGDWWLLGFIACLVSCAIAVSAFGCSRSQPSAPLNDSMFSASVGPDSDAEE